jgi:integrase
LYVVPPSKQKHSPGSIGSVFNARDALLQLCIYYILRRIAFAPNRTFIRRYMQLVKEAKLPVLPFHSVWHAHATALLKAGIHLKIVSERLGHSGIQITADTYSHVTPEMQRDAIGGVDTALFG